MKLQTFENNATISLPKEKELTMPTAYSANRFSSSWNPTEEAAQHRKNNPTRTRQNIDDLLIDPIATEEEKAKIAARRLKKNKTSKHKRAPKLATKATAEKLAEFLKIKKSNQG